MNRKKAFSLIELSIVILIIGILVAGVTQSSRIINQVRLQGARAITQNSPINSIKDLAIWLETTMEGSFIIDEAQEGSTISEWRDNNPLTTQKNKFIQPNASIRPIYKASAINNLPAIQFEDATSALVGRTFTYPNAISGDFIPTNRFTLFIVLSIDATSNVNLFRWENFAGGGGTRFLLHAIYSDNNIYLDVGVCCDGTSRVSVGVNINDYLKNPKIMTLYKNSANMGIRTNGAVIVNSNSANAQIPAGWNYTFYFGESFRGKISEFILFNRFLNTEEIREVEQYLSKKWAIRLVN